MDLVLTVLDSMEMNVVLHSPDHIFCFWRL